VYFMVRSKLVPSSDINAICVFYFFLAKLMALMQKLFLAVLQEKEAEELDADVKAD